MVAAGLVLGSAGAVAVSPVPVVQAPDESIRGQASLPFAAPAVMVAADATAITPAPPAAPDERILAVEAFLAGRPLAPYAASMVAAADRYGIDWRILPVISILESEGGRTACGGNAWGFAKCQIRFADFEQGIEASASTLASYRSSTVVAICIWATGETCNSPRAVAYASQASYLFSRLGGHLAVPYVPAPPEEEVGAAEVPATPSPDSTPPVEQAIPLPPPGSATPAAPPPPTEAPPTSTPAPTEPSATATPTPAP